MEGETSVERSTSPPEDLLKELAANETSLIALLKTLLSPKTMPHLFMIVLMSTALYFVANSNNGGDIAALGFISLSLGYAITAIFSANEKVRSWITVTGNLFFFTRAFLETIFAFLLIRYWAEHGTVEEVFSHRLWDSYMWLKHWSEVAILGLMLYILQSRFTSGVGGVGSNGNGGSSSNGNVPNRRDYQQVPGVDTNERKTTKTAIVV